MRKPKLRYNDIGPRTPRGELSPFGARYIGRKAKSAEFEQAQRCDYVIDGKERLIRKKRKKQPFDLYNVVIVVGGKRCTNPVDTIVGPRTSRKRRCKLHRSATYEKEQEANDE